MGGAGEYICKGCGVTYNVSYYIYTHTHTHLTKASNEIYIYMYISKIEIDYRVVHSRIFNYGGDTSGTMSTRDFN